MTKTPEADRMVAQAAAEDEFNRKVAEAERELTIYSRQGDILALLEKVCHGLRLAKLATKALRLYGVTNQQPMLDSIETSKAELIKLGDSISAIVTRIEEDRSDA